MNGPLTPPGNSFPHPFTISLDDSDTPWGGCTTHLAWLLLREYSSLILLADYPLLVRLNPVVPRKTRGNAAVVIRGYSRVPVEDLYERALELADSYATERPPGKAPGVALYRGIDAWRVPGLRRLYERALTTYLPRSLVLEEAESAGVVVEGGSGVVGAAASLAALAPRDPYTYELIAYRRSERLGSDRCIKGGLDYAGMEPVCSIANYDQYNGRLASAPGGPDPVLAGFRGRDPSCLAVFKELLCEEPAGWLLYRSNQHTGSLMVPVGGLIRPYNYVRVEGVVSRDPWEAPGGHVFITLESGQARLTVAFYRESSPLRDAARLLRGGDIVEVEGGVVPRSKGPTLAADALTVKRLAPLMVRVAPRCPRCGSRMKSMGKGKGYKCPECGYRDPNGAPLTIRVPRRLLPGRYTPAISSGRHLTLYNWWTPPSGYEPRLINVEYVSSYTSSPPPAASSQDPCQPMV